MDKNLLVTIAIPTYNRIEQLKNCLNSILPQIKQKQTWIEVLVIDNKSPDGTYDYLKKLKHKNLRVMQNSKNIGAENNILKVTELAKGRYVFWLSDDDILLDGALDFLKDFLEKLPDNVGWVFSPIPVINYVTNKEMVNIGLGDKIINITPSYLSVLRYAKYGWTFARQIFLREKIDEYFLKGDTGNVYFILSIPVQMLMTCTSMYHPKPLIKHTYGNPVFWEEWGEDVKIRSAKQELDFAWVLSGILEHINKNKGLIHQIKSKVTSIIWVMSCAYDRPLIRGSLPVFFRLRYLYIESGNSKRRVFFYFYLFCLILLIVPTTIARILHKLNK